MFVRDLAKTYDHIASVSQGKGGAEVTAQVSNLWKEIFAERKNFPSLDGLIAFRRNGETYGIGDPLYSNDADLDRHCTKNALLLKDDNIPDDFLSLVNEPTIGAPRLSARHALGFDASPNFLKNLKNAFRIATKIRKEMRGAPIDVCEIGPGYGLLAVLLHQVLNIRSYTIIDLRQNLYLSSYYLSCALPDRTIVVQPSQHVTQEGEIAFFSAEDINQVNSDFDLVLNIDSFGEMPLATARYYVDWAKGRLKNGGLLHSDNRVRVRENSGPQRFSDLGFLDGWEFKSLDGTETQAEFFSQPHHMAFLSPNPSKVYNRETWDLVSVLYTIGLGKSLTAQMEHDWKSFDTEAVRLLRAITEGGNYVEAVDAIDVLEQRKSNDPVVDFVLFYFKFAQGRPLASYQTNLANYCASSAREPADAIARSVDILTEKNLEKRTAKVVAFVAIYPHLEGEIRSFVGNPERSIRLLKSNAVESITAKRLGGGFSRKVVRRITGNYFK